MTPRRVVHGASVGSPAMLYLQEFGSQVWSAFGELPYLVGSAIYSKRWRDVDVRLILDDKDFEPYGDPHRPNGKWAAMCMAFSLLGQRMTGLPIDFQIQQRTDANKRFKNPRNALGIIELREGCKRCLARRRKS